MVLENLISRSNIYIVDQGYYVNIVVQSHSLALNKQSLNELISSKVRNEFEGQERLQQERDSAQVSSI